VEGRHYLRLLTRNWLAISTIVVLAVLIGVLVHVVVPQRYESTVSFLVQPNQVSSSSAEVYQGELLAESRAQLYGRLMTGAELAQLVSARLDGVVSAKRVRADVAPSVTQGSSVIDVSVVDDSPAVAVSVARGLAAELPAYTATLEESANGPATTVRVVAQPSNAEATGAGLIGALGVAVLVGLVLAFLVAVLRELTNRRIRDVDDLRAAVGPGTVCVPLRRRRGQHGTVDQALVPLSRLLSSATMHDRPVVVVPLSSSAGTGAWILDLATRLSAHGERVALVDADLERRLLPSGLTSTVEIVGAEVVTATTGGDSPDHAEAPNADVIDAAIIKVLSAARERADIVLVVTGSVLLRSHPTLIATEEAEVIVLVERNRTSAADVRTAVEVVRQFGSEVGAAVLARGSRRARPRS
jgi:capsular polysaccharide biosynthesis protein/Mrp family chromosome partitioning ATPase